MTPVSSSSLPDNQADETGSEQRLLRVAWRTFHRVRCRRLQRQCEGGEDVGNQIEPQNLESHERQRPADHQSDKHREDFRDVARQQVMEELENVPVNDPPLLDGSDDAGEVIVGDHHVGVFLGDLGPLDAHRDADVRLLHGRGVVHSVARHGDNVPLLLQRFDDPQLVLGRNAGKHGCVGHNPLPALSVQVGQLATVNGD